MNVSILDRSPAGEARLSSLGAMIRLRGVSKSFGNHNVLQAIDLEIPPGQFVAIVGRSGCGKSTLLRLRAGLEKPTRGTIEIDGRAAAWREQVRLMFQEPRLLPWQRVLANVIVGLSHAASGEDRRDQAMAAIAQVGLRGRERDWPAILSGGQRQRAALARALV